MKFGNLSSFEFILQNDSYSQFFKYLLVSLLCLSIDFSSYLFFYFFLKFEIDIAATIGYCLGLFFSYFLLISYVFKATNNKIVKPPLRFFLYIISGAVGAISTYVTVNFAVYIFGNNLYFAKFMAVIISFLTVYLFRKKIVFA
jgi:putative flippase GtrA